MKDLKFPVVAKIVSSEVLHKSDIGGVRLNLGTAGAVEEAIGKLQKAAANASAKLEGYLVEEMATPGTEMVIGGVNDPRFGPMVMVGMGGIYIEVFKDVCYRLCPITREEAGRMLDELRCAPLLDGARGRAPVSREALIDMLLKVGGEHGFMMRNPSIAELDLNPVIVDSKRAVAVDAAIVLAADEVDARPQPKKTIPAAGDVLKEFQPLFQPSTIAVVGASAEGGKRANIVIRRLKSFGFSGAIYPIHPTAPEIEGLRAYRSMSETPQPIDYAYVSIAGERVAGLLRSAHGRVRFAQVIASGFGESEDGKALERELVATARAAGCRILGPNCIGAYSPRGGLTFAADAPRESGSIGVILQSGGLGTDIIKRGQVRGLRFSGLVTIGNSADVTPTDLLEFYLNDPATRIVGLYLEDVKDGRRFFDLLRESKTSKPVVLMKGGRTAQGRVAAASHTGALADDDRTWSALAAQTPTVIVADVDRFLDTLVALQFMGLQPQRPVRRLALFGNGGGMSVLAADQFAAQGIEISPFAEPTRKQLEALQLGSGTSVSNPIDAPVSALQQDSGRIAAKILNTIYQSGDVDVVLMHLNLASFVGREGVDPLDTIIAAAAAAREQNGQAARFALVLRSDGSKELDDRRRHYRDVAARSGIAVFDEIAPAAVALAAVRIIEHRIGTARAMNDATCM